MGLPAFKALGLRPAPFMWCSLKHHAECQWCESFCFISVLTSEDILIFLCSECCIFFKCKRKGTIELLTDFKALAEMINKLVLGKMCKVLMHCDPAGCPLLPGRMCKVLTHHDPAGCPILPVFGLDDKDSTYTESETDHL